jgi:hypothetical protein
VWSSTDALPRTWSDAPLRNRPSAPAFGGVIDLVDRETLNVDERSEADSRSQDATATAGVRIWSARSSTPNPASLATIAALAGTVGASEGSRLAVRRAATGGSPSSRLSHPSYLGQRRAYTAATS